MAEGKIDGWISKERLEAKWTSSRVECPVCAACEADSGSTTTSTWSTSDIRLTDCEHECVVLATVACPHLVVTNSSTCGTRQP